VRPNEPTDDVDLTREPQHANPQITQRGNHSRGRSSADLTAILVKGDITNPMQAVLDLPLVTRQLSQALSVRFFLLGRTGVAPRRLLK